MSAHPTALGSALTHPSITTDFSEALLEFVTGATKRPWEVIQELCDLHNFTYDKIGDEMLWPLSMPCTVNNDDSIPLARYGNSNIGQMKTIYRRGLGHRYGRAMQTIAGIHFNFSPAASFWRRLADARGDNRAADDFQSAAYFALLRNFRRYAWLVLYLFGASPAVCRTFLEGREHSLQLFDSDTLYLPNATSLRMSDLGYTSAAQAKLNISLNSLDEYVAGLTRAIQTPYPPYAGIGVRDGEKWRQLSGNILQIANEFYSVVRPKRVAKSGEKPTSALRDRGVEYVEIRALDVNPFDPVGVNQNQMRFMECFLLFCAVRSSEVTCPGEQVDVEFNQREVAARGREPQLNLRHDGKPRALREWSLSIFEQIALIAKRLDNAVGGTDYADALSMYRKTIEDPSLTPSARVLEAMRNERQSHAAFGLALARQHKSYFDAIEPLSSERVAGLEEQVVQSLARQRDIEAAQSTSFDVYLRDYFATV